MSTGDRHSDLQVPAQGCLGLMAPVMALFGTQAWSQFEWLVGMCPPEGGRRILRVRSTQQFRDLGQFGQSPWGWDSIWGANP